MMGAARNGCRKMSRESVGPNCVTRADLQKRPAPHANDWSTCTACAVGMKAEASHFVRTTNSVFATGTLD